MSSGKGAGWGVRRPCGRPAASGNASALFSEGASPPTFNAVLALRNEAALRRYGGPKRRSAPQLRRNCEGECPEGPTHAPLTPQPSPRDVRSRRWRWLWPGCRLLETRTARLSKWGKLTRRIREVNSTLFYGRRGLPRLVLLGNSFCFRANRTAERLALGR